MKATTWFLLSKRSRTLRDCSWYKTLLYQHLKVIELEDRIINYMYTFKKNAKVSKSEACKIFVYSGHIIIIVNTSKLHSFSKVIINPFLKRKKFLWQVFELYLQKQNPKQSNLIYYNFPNFMNIADNKMNSSLRLKYL